MTYYINKKNIIQIIFVLENLFDNDQMEGRKTEYLI